MCCCCCHWVSILLKNVVCARFSWISSALWTHETSQAMMRVRSERCLHVVKSRSFSLSLSGTRGAVFHTNDIRSTKQMPVFLSVAEVPPTSFKTNPFKKNVTTIKAHLHSQHCHFHRCNQAPGKSVAVYMYSVYGRTVTSSHHLEPPQWSTSGSLGLWTLEATNGVFGTQVLWDH